MFSVSVQGLCIREEVKLCSIVAYFKACTHIINRAIMYQSFLLFTELVESQFVDSVINNEIKKNPRLIETYYEHNR